MTTLEQLERSTAAHKLAEALQRAQESLGQPSGYLEAAQLAEELVAGFDREMVEQADRLALDAVTTVITEHCELRGWRSHREVAELALRQAKVLRRASLLRLIDMRSDNYIVDIKTQGTSNATG